MPGPSPTPDLMDSLGLFCHGEFLEYDNDNPELLLLTHGEFPRPGRAVAVEVVAAPAAPAVGTGRRAPRRPECVVRKDDEEAIAMALLFADDDDWF